MAANHAIANNAEDDVRAPGIERGARLIIITLGVILATLLEMIDTTIVNVALPNIQGNLGATIDEGAFIVTGYIVANVIVVPLTPWLQGRFGLKVYYLASIALFTLTSIMCGLSNSFPELVLWRILQGAGGGGLISTSQTLLRQIFPPSKQGTAQGLFAGSVIIGPTLGPLIGGLITDNLDWRWCFFINLPVGVVAFVVLAALLHGEKPRHLPLDRAGVVLLAAGLGSMQYVLDQGERKDWFSDTSICIFSAIALVGLVAFTLWELYGARDPIVDLRVLRHPGVTAGSLLGATLGIALFGSLLILPQYTQGLLGFTALLSGQLLSLRAIAMAFFLPLGAFLATGGRFDPRLQIGIGMVLIALSSFMLADVTTSDTPLAALGPSLVVAGIGLSQVFIPLQLAIFAGLSPGDVPKAASFFNLARQLGSSVAAAGLVTLLTRNEATHRVALASAMTLASAPVARYLSAHGGAGSSEGIGGLVQFVEIQARTMGYADVARITGYLTLVLTPLVFVLRTSETPVDLASIGHE